MAASASASAFATLLSFSSAALRLLRYETRMLSP